MKNPRFGLAVVAVLALSAVLACAAPLTPDSVRPAQVPGQPTIVVVRSSDNPLYNQPLRLFTETMQGQVSLFTFAAGKETALAKTIAAQKPALLFTLGSQATAFARAALPEVPTVFAMVLDHERLKITDQPQVAGVALEASVSNTFAQFRLVNPKMKRVLAFHSQLTDTLAARAKDELQKLGIELVAIKVAGPDDVKTQFPASLAGYDAIWQINDPKVFTEAEFYFLRDKSRETRVPFFASLSEEFAQAGATAAVSVDLTSLGAQVAKIAADIISGTPPKTIGVQPPIGAYLALNLDVAKAIGLDVPAASLNNINKIISSEADKMRIAETDEPAAETPDDATSPAVATATTPVKPDAGRDPKSPDVKPKDGGKPKSDGTKVADNKGDKKPDAPPPVKPKKPRDTRTVVFYDPDANHEAILQITNWFSEFLRTVDPQLRLQPVRNVGTFERMTRNSEADFAIVPASYVARKAKAENLVPLLVPSSKGDTKYRKVLFAAAGATKMTTIAATAPGGNAAEVTRILTASGVKMDGVTIIPVSKDVDALLALVFGQVEAALVMPDSLEVIKTIQPGAENNLRKVQETKATTRPPLCAISDVASPELQAKLIAAMKRMGSDAAGARAMRSLGLDAWVAFEPGMLR